MSLYEKTVSGLELARGGKDALQHRRYVLWRRVAFSSAARLIESQSLDRDAIEMRIVFDASAWTGR